MRRIAIVGALALTLAAAAPVFAASPSPQGASHVGRAQTTRTAKVTQGVWRSKGSSGSVHYGATLTVAASAKSGRLSYVATGAKAGSTLRDELLIGPCGTASDRIVVTETVKVPASGYVREVVHLSAAQAGRLHAAMKAGTKISISTTDGTTKICGAFSR